MKLVYIASPYAGDIPTNVKRTKAPGMLVIKDET